MILLYAERGEHSRAQWLLRKTLEIRLEAPNRGYTTAPPLLDMFSIYGAKDSFEENERILEQILVNERQLLGGNTPLITWRSLSQVYWDHAKFDLAQGRLQNAKKNFEKADAVIAGHVSVVRPVNSLQAAEISRLAQLRASLGRHEEAEALFTEVLGYRRSNPKESPNLPLTLAELGWIRILRGKYPVAETALREACSLLKSGGEQRHNCDALLGASLVGQKKFVEAEPLLLSAYAGLVTASTAEGFPQHAYLNASPAQVSEMLVERASNRAFLLATARFFASDVGVWIVRMYEEWRKPEESGRWKLKLNEDKTSTHAIVQPMR
jgi:tetratricopeptide (TPR) repeat protein